MLKELDEALQEQQKYIDILEKKLVRLEEKLTQVQHQQEGGFVHTSPPHSIKF